MNTKLISQGALDIIDQYKNFRIENAICSVPYFNNRHSANRATFRVEAGKGSPKDIYEDIVDKAFKDKIDLKTFDSNLLKKYLVDNDIGIDCSGYAYYILNEESKSLGRGSIDLHLSFPYCDGILKRIKCKLRPVENAGVQTFSHSENSEIVLLKDIKVGDIITMMGNTENNNKDHILVVYQIEYQNFLPTVIHYTHAISWPTDGEYGHGIHDGVIEVLNLSKDILEQNWVENEKKLEDNYTFTGAKKSTTELRRLRWF